MERFSAGHFVTLLMPYGHPGRDGFTVNRIKVRLALQALEEEFTIGHVRRRCTFARSFQLARISDNRSRL